MSLLSKKNVAILLSGLMLTAVVSGCGGDKKDEKKDADMMM